MCKVQRANRLPVPKEGDVVESGYDVSRGEWWQLVSQDGSKSVLVYGPKPSKVYGHRNGNPGPGQVVRAS